MKFVWAIIFFSVGLAGGLWADAQIQLVLATHCFECHGSKDKGGLKLDSRKVALKRGDSGAVIVSGKSKKSPLIKAIAAAAKKEGYNLQTGIGHLVTSDLFLIR